MRARLSAFILAAALALPAAYAAACPSGGLPLHASSVPDEALRRAVVCYYDLPEEALAATRCEYVRIDLDYDGRNEILAVLRGPWTSGTGGDSALILEETPDGLQVKQALTLVRTPLLAAHRTYGALSDQRPLILLRAGGGAKAETVILTSRDGRYGSVLDAPPLSDRRPVPGVLLFPEDGTPEALRGFSLADASHIF